MAYHERMTPFASRGTIVAITLLAVSGVSAACSGGDGSLGSADSGRGADGAEPPADGTTTDGTTPPPATTPAGEPVGADGACPCPTGSYCDLTANRCKPGCTTDTDCPGDRFCDTSARTCRAGCREDTDCPTSDVCDDHVCRNLCGSCDDKNPCTVDACVRGACTNTPGNENGACADDANPCTADVCKAGACTHPAANDGGACAGGPCVTNAACSAGQCVGTNKPDATSCGATAFDLCLAGKCRAAKALCETKNAVNDNYIYSEWKEPGGGSGSQIYYSCQTTSPTSMAMNWPPGTVGSGGTPRFWSCSAVRASPTSSRALACFP